MAARSAQKSASYLPLRVHGQHSLLAGVDRPAELVERAAGLGIGALALADVDSLAGLVDFLGAARERGVRPIVAAEVSDPRAEGRLVALVRDEQGYRNLCKLVSARRLGRDPGKHGARLGSPEEDFDLARSAAEHQEGLIFLADHPRLLVELMGRVAPEQVLAAIAPAGLRKPWHAARALQAGEARNTHLAPPRASPRPPIERETREEEELAAGKTPPPARAAPALEMIEAARATGCATLAVPDVYYATPSGAAHHRVRIAILHNALLAELPSEWLAEAPAHLCTPAEVCALYASLPDVPGPWKLAAPPGVPPMVARTLAVAEACSYAPPLDRVLLPEVELEAGETPYSKLCALAFAGASRRYRPLRPEVLRRLDHELSTIDRLGFSAYFLLVERIAEHARANGIPCVGRGSAADSLVAYCLGLTDADPFRYQLIFERFLNPSRKDRPDIDLDFCWRRRDRVIEHVYELFGAERTAMISTLNCFGLRAAFRETALVEGIPPAEVNRWSRLLPHFPPRSFFDGEGTGEEDRSASTEEELATSPIASALCATPEAHDFPFDDERWRRVLRAADALLGVPRHFGLHPGGVVVSPGPITDFVACQRAAKGVVVTQLDKDAVEAIGLVKMDLLGNRALTVIDDCLAELARAGERVELETLREDDPDTARTLREGRTIGCFQIESPGMRNLLKQTRAGDMDAVIQAVALIRPGPAASGMKDAYIRRFRGLEPPTPPHPRLTDLLWETRGVMLYQEDVMQVAARMAGMDLAQADLLRRALQKRRLEELPALRASFVAGCAREGVSHAEAEHVWELVSNFASFGFCKAHAVTYGRIAYRAAWLKTHHPAIYMAAFLASDTGYYEQRVYVEEARRLGVAILPPDVNKSGADCGVERRGAGGAAALRIGLRLVKGLSQRTLETLLAARAAGGAFVSLPDFLERSGAHEDEAERLIQCGAFDAFDHTRPELSWRLHLLRAPKLRPPRERARTGGRPLDVAELAAYGGTPASRLDELVRAAREKSGGWRGGLGLGNAKLAPGESASLFPPPPTPAAVLPRLPDPSRAEQGALEYELLGLCVRDHPTTIFPCPADERVRGRRLPLLIPCAELERFRGARVTLRGWPAASRRVHTSRGEWMRFLTLEDESGLAEVVLFPPVYRRDGRHLAEFGALCVSGLVQDQMGACTLEAEHVW